MSLTATLALALTLSLAGGLPQDDPPIPADKEVQTTASGLKYSVLRPGDGKRHASVEDQIKIHYMGWTQDGKLFDRSEPDAPVTYPLRNLIGGWKEGIPLMTEGAKFKFLIPWQLAYGERGNPRGGIPPKADLVFVVELLEIIPAPKMPEFHPGDPAQQKHTESGLVWEVIEPGTGERPKADDIVELAYAMWTEEGQLMDCTERRGRNIRTAIERLNLPYLKEAAQLTPEGGRLRFVVPPALFYPPNTPDAQRRDVSHVFEIEIVTIIEPLPIPAFTRLSEDEKVKTESGLEYEVISKSESGVKPKQGQACAVHYAGWLTNGVLFDSSFAKAEPFTFAVGTRSVIAGWDEGVALMEKGDVFRFHIPAELAYGARGRPPVIGPNEPLIFYVELVEVGAPKR